MPNRKHKQEPPKIPAPDEVPDVAPPGASFNTEEGRAAHGMRKDLGRDSEKSHPDEDDDEGEEAERPKDSPA
jgi:hypothetical protein